MGEAARLRPGFLFLGGIPLPVAGGVEGLHSLHAGKERGVVSACRGVPLEFGYGAHAREHAPEETVGLRDALCPQAGFHAQDILRNRGVEDAAEIGFAFEPIAVGCTQIEMAYRAENGVIALPDGDFRRDRPHPTGNDCILGGCAYHVVAPVHQHVVPNDAAAAAGLHEGAGLIHEPALQKLFGGLFAIGLKN